MAPKGHSFAVGGSSAHRLLQCPANITERLKLPPGAVTDVAFAMEAAEEGTRLHDGMEAWFRTGSLPDMPREDIALILKAYDMAMASVDAHMPGAEIYGVETEVDSFLPGAFGTTDLVMLTDRMVAIVDWKFGGYYVPILYGNTPNPQPLFYLSGLRWTHPELFEGRDRFLLVISQPKVGDAAECVTIGVDELDAFEQALSDAFVAAMNPSPAYRKGEWCTFCAAKPVCPKWTGPALDLSRIVAAPTAPEVQPAAFATWLGEALTLVDGLTAWAKGVEPAALAWLESGKPIPGWTLKPKRASRKWRYPDTHIIDELVTQGHSIDKIAPPSLLTPAQMEKAIGTLPADLVVKESAGFNVVPDGSKTPVTREEQAQRLMAATAALGKS